MMNKQELIHKIESVLSKLRNPNVLLSASLMEYKEIAFMLNDKKALEWVVNQLEGFKNIMLLENFRVEVKEGEELVTLCESISMLEQKAHCRYDIPTDTTYDNVYDMIRINIAEEKKAILETLNWVRQKAHTWSIEKLVEIKSEYLPEQIFAEIQRFVDEKIKDISPEITERFAAIYDDLSSSNQARWANAILSCREILRSLANMLLPATRAAKSKNGHRLGPEEYKNRLIEFLKQRQKTETFIAIFGSTLTNFSDRLEAIYAASCKGKFICKHKDDAKRQIIYTYMLIADILRLVD